MFLKIGRVVGKLAQHSDARVAQVSSDLVATWKKALRGSATIPEAEMPQTKRAKTDQRMPPVNKLSVDTKYSGPMTKEERRNKVIFNRAFIQF